MNPTKILKQHNLKVTAARKSVLKYLHGKPPQSAQDIIDYLSQANIPADPVTVYRSLDQFSTKGIVKQVNFHEGKFRYELAGDHHHHLVCQSCDTVIPIEDCNIQESVSDQADQHGFTISHHSLEFFGKCNNCKQNK